MKHVDYLVLAPGRWSDQGTYSTFDTQAEAVKAAKLAALGGAVFERTTRWDKTGRRSVKHKLISSTVRRRSYNDDLRDHYRAKWEQDR